MDNIISCRRSRNAKKYDKYSSIILLYFQLFIHVSFSRTRETTGGPFSAATIDSLLYLNPATLFDPLMLRKKTLEKLKVPYLFPRTQVYPAALGRHPVDTRGSLLKSRILSLYLNKIHPVYHFLRFHPWVPRQEPSHPFARDAHSLGYAHYT